MNYKLTAWLVAAALGLAAYVYFVDLRGRPSAVEMQRAGKLFPDLDPARVTAVELARSNQTIRVELVQDHWQLANPRYPAQATAIDAFLDALTRLNRQNEIPAQEIIANSGGLSPFGLDPPWLTLKLQLETNVVQLRVGSKTLVGDRVYVQPVGASGIFTTDASLLQHLPASANQWRNPMLVHRDNLSFDRIAITAGSRSLKLERDSTNQLWRLAYPEPPKRADFSQVEFLVQQLFNTRVSRFVSDDPKEDLEAFGLQTPEAELVLAAGTNPVFQIQFGRSPTNDPTQVYARRLSQTNVVLIPRALAELAEKPYTEFRDHALLSFRPNFVDRIEAQADESFAIQRQSSNHWQIVEPFQAAADPQLMQLFLDDLAGLRIIRFEKDVVTDFAPYGLVKPARQYLLKTTVTNSLGRTNQPLVQIAFGQRPTNEVDKVFCRRLDESSVYVVSAGDMLRVDGAAFALRDRRVWTFASSNVTAVSILQRGEKQELVRDAATGMWSRDDAVRHAAIEETLHRLGQLQADAWAARGKDAAEKFGTTGGKHEIILDLVEAGQRRRLAVAFGKLASSGQPYAAVSLEQNVPVVFKFPVAAYELVARYLSIPSVSTEP